MSGSNMSKLNFFNQLKLFYSLFNLPLKWASGDESVLEVEFLSTSCNPDQLCPESQGRKRKVEFSALFPDDSEPVFRRTREPGNNKNQMIWQQEPRRYCIIIAAENVVVFEMSLPDYINQSITITKSAKGFK
jgi:hypothetical protein